MFKNSKIYVAGHTGMLGSAIVRALITEGYENLVLKTRNELDLTDQKAVRSFFQKEKPEYVFLTAGLTGGIQANKTYPANFLHINLVIQDNVFEAALKFNAKRVIFYGSSCMYPKFCCQPMKEEDLFTGAIEPTSEAYAIAKMTGLMACKAYNTQYHKTEYLTLIPNNMYGPNDHFDLENSHVLSALIRKFHDAKETEKPIVTLWGTGTPKREFVYVEDVAEASVFVMKRVDAFENDYFNVGTETDISIKELALLISSTVGFQGEILWDATKPDGTPRKLLNSSKFVSLGWRSKTLLASGIEQTYHWYLENQTRIQ